MILYVVKLLETGRPMGLTKNNMINLYDLGMFNLQSQRLSLIINFHFQKRRDSELPEDSDQMNPSLKSHMYKRAGDRASK